jgi:hypothetical protein
MESAQLLNRQNRSGAAPPSVPSHKDLFFSFFYKIVLFPLFRLGPKSICELMEGEREQREEVAAQRDGEDQKDERERKDERDDRDVRDHHESDRRDERDERDHRDRRDHRDHRDERRDSPRVRLRCTPTPASLHSSFTSSPLY